MLTAWGGELKSPEANVIKCFIIQHHTLVSILNELMNRKGSIIGLHNGV